MQRNRLYPDSKSADINEIEYTSHLEDFDFFSQEVLRFVEIFLGDCLDCHCLVRPLEKEKYDHN